MRRHFIISFVFGILFHSAFSQAGGEYGFQSLNMVSNARTAALGGYNVSLADGDLALFYQNPALLDSTKVGDFVIQYNPFFVDIQTANIQYKLNLPVVGDLAMGLQYTDFGNFDETDATGLVFGEFRANDFQITLGKSHRVGPFVLGANLKFVNSTIAELSSSALMMDFGGLYKVPGKDLSIGMAVNNLGLVFSDYVSTSPTLPLQVTAGTTFKPEGMPIRFSITAHNFTDPSSAFFDSDDNPNFADQMFKRISVGGEVLFSENVQFLIGYDHNRKRELRLNDTAGGSGFSFGFMINIKKYRFRYSRATYHAAGGTSFISLQTNLKEFKRLF